MNILLIAFRPHRARFTYLAFTKNCQAKNELCSNHHISPSDQSMWEHYSHISGLKFHGETYWCAPHQPNFDSHVSYFQLKDNSQMNIVLK